MGRSVETIRYTLKQFDHEHPDLAVFPNSTGPLSEETKKKIYQQHRRGSSVDSLAAQYCRTKTEHLSGGQRDARRRIFELPLDLIPNPQFDKAGVEKEILGPLPQTDQPTRKMRLPSGLPPYLASLYEVPLLTREQEAHLFRKFNYLNIGPSSCARGSIRPAQEQRDGRDRIALRTDRGHEQPDCAGEPAVGGFDRQAARRARERISSSW